MTAAGRERPPWSAFEAALEAAGFRPSRRLGQCFLRDGNMARAIVRDARVGRGDFVLEIGPGCGFLSAHLLEAGVRLLAVELDRRLIEVAERFLRGAGELELLHADALAGKHELSGAVVERLPARGPWHVVSNLPYSAGTPILALLARLSNPPASMTALVQRELGQRIAAQPGGREWGALAIRLRLVYEVERIRRVGPELFWPRPRVESALVRLDRRPEAALEPSDWSRLDALLEVCFSERRKALAGTLAAALGSRETALALLSGHGVDPRSRPEAVPAPTWLELSRDPLWDRG